MFEVGPARAVPAAFELGALQQGDGFVLLDGVDAALHHGAVVLGPVGGDVGDGGAAVALEPSGLLAASGHAAGEHDFKGALAQGDGGRFCR